jgi:hypothetical protein
VDSGKKNIGAVYIIDMLKPVAAHVKPRVFRNFLVFHVDVFCVDHSQVLIEILEIRGDRLFGGEGSYSPAEAVFNIEGRGSV